MMASPKPQPSNSIRWLCKQSKSYWDLLVSPALSRHNPQRCRLLFEGSLLVVQRYPPVARCMALRSQRAPNSSASVPKRSRTATNGACSNDWPSATTSTTSTSMAAAAPVNAERQPRIDPTARMTVSASTNSTRDARNDATMDGPACIHVIMKTPRDRQLVAGFLRGLNLSASRIRTGFCDLRGQIG
jgi:hypothetical protein